VVRIRRKPCDLAPDGFEDGVDVGSGSISRVGAHFEQTSDAEAGGVLGHDRSIKPVCPDRVNSPRGRASLCYLLQKLTNTNLCFGTQMPKSGRSLPQSEVDLIAAWICSGAPE
jgi:hypothetical protein